MNPLAFAATFVAGGTIGVLAVALVNASHDCADTFVCPMCRDLGVHPIERPGRAPAAVWCRACQLGKGLAARAVSQRAPQPATARTGSRDGSPTVSRPSPAAAVADVVLYPMSGRGRRHYAAEPESALVAHVYLARARCGAVLVTPAGLRQWNLDVTAVTEDCVQCTGGHA